LRSRFTIVFRLVWRMRFSAEYVLAILVQLSGYLKAGLELNAGRATPKNRMKFRRRRQWWY